MVAISAIAGLLLAVLWSYELVDSVIGGHVANGLLGHDARTDVITGALPGLIFAFVSGLAGTFTACNIAMVASLGPMANVASNRSPQARAFLRPVGLLAVGMVTISAAYGAVGVWLGDRLPQLSAATAGGMPVRLIQASVVFGLVGLALLVIGLGALGVIPDPFAGRPSARVLAFGALIGCFLIGRPYPLFNKLFHWAAENGSPLYGAAAFVAQSVGNIVLVSAVFVLVNLVTRGGLVRLLAANPRRSAMVTGALLIALAVFSIVYWDVRVPAMFGHGWFPVMFYN
ncbi:hypothetical protein [Micromonospora sp. NPDC003776]